MTTIDEFLDQLRGRDLELAQALADRDSQQQRADDLFRSLEDTRAVLGKARADLNGMEQQKGQLQLQIDRTLAVIRNNGFKAIGGLEDSVRQVLQALLSMRGIAEMLSKTSGSLNFSSPEAEARDRLEKIGFAEVERRMATDKEVVALLRRERNEALHDLQNEREIKTAEKGIMLQEIEKNSRLRQRIASLKKALKPFAEWSDMTSRDGVLGDRLPLGLDATKQPGSRPNIGDLRHAKVELEKEDE